MGMPRKAIREPQTEAQQIDDLTRRLAVADLENVRLRHELDVFRGLMTRFLTTEQILELVAEMETLRKGARSRG